MEFDTFDGFLDWFEKQKPEWQPVLAARIALRALPIAFSDKSEDNPLSSEDERVLLQLFRAVLALDDAVHSKSGGNSQLFLGILKYFDNQTDDQMPEIASYLAIVLVLYLKSIADHIERVQDNFGAPEKIFRHRRLSSMRFDLINRAALLEDLHKLDTISPAVLNTMPLFPDTDKAPFGKHWPPLRFAMRATEHGWEVWDKYYWSKLTGNGDSEDLMDAAEVLSPENWLAEPWKVNKKLAELSAMEPTGFGEEEQKEIGDLEITDSESFKKWLQDKPVKWAQVLVMRIALRVLPFTEAGIKANSLNPFIQQGYFLTTFRSSIITWASRSYPANDMIIAASEASAAYAMHPIDASSDIANTAAKAAIHMAVDAVFNEDPGTSAAYAADYASHAAVINDNYNIWKNINRDAEFLQSPAEEMELSACKLSAKPLWIELEIMYSVPMWCLKADGELRRKLHSLDPNWHVWTEWYQSRLEGTESWGLKQKNAETLVLRIIKQSDEWWKQGQSIVNAEIAKWLAEFREVEAQGNQPQLDFSEELVVPAEPEQSVGLSYGYSEGKLSASGSHPLPDEAARQESLFQRVKTKAQKLNGLLLTTANQFPELAEAAVEYLELINEPIEQIDIDSLWSVGGALFELKTAYANQNHIKTMSSELEPPQTAALSGLCRDHGAFILGFERGEELVERADRFAQNIQRAKEIIEPSKPVLINLTDNRDLVEDETRRLHKVILDALNETDWAVSRTSYSAYVTIRNGTLSIAKLLFGSMGQGLIPIALSATSFATLAGVSVDQTAVINAVQFLQLHSAQLLTIFKHSPEMHAYVQAAIDLIKREKKLLEND